MSVEGTQEHPPVSLLEYLKEGFNRTVDGLHLHKLNETLNYEEEPKFATRKEKIIALVIEAFLHMAPVFAIALAVTSPASIIGIVSILQSEVMLGSFLLSVGIGISIVASAVLGTMWFIEDATSPYERDLLNS